jgi:UMP-CMP kinase
MADASSPTFSSDKVSVVFVLGGPGAGKGTQCANLVREFGFTHLSAGDLLRAEQDREGSQYGDMIRSYIREGTIVPMEVTIVLLEKAISAELERRGADVGQFLIDGFPRKMDQALHFDRAVCRARFVLFFECAEDVMEARLLDRGKTSGRADDNIESIRKRFRVFEDTSMPVVEAFEKEGRVERVDATPEPAKVFDKVREVMHRRGFEKKA